MYRSAVVCDTPCLIPHAAGDEKLPASRSQQPDERPHLCGALDIGELHHIPHLDLDRQQQD